MDLRAEYRISAGVEGQSQLDKLNEALRGTSLANQSVRDAGQQMVLTLRDQIAAVSADSGEMMRYRAALLGVSDQAGPLIAQLEAAKKAANEKAAADAAATKAARELEASERSAASQRDRFVQGLRDQVATQGKSTAEILEYRAAQLGVAKDAAPLIAKLREADGQMGKTGVSAAQTAAAMRTLPAQFTDIATQLAGGQSPFLILLQQGGQIKDQFGSIGGAFGGVARYALALINPLTLAAAAIAVVGAAAYLGAKQDEDLRDSLLLSGNQAGLTAGRFEALAAGVKAASGITAGAAREIAAAAASTGAFGPGSIDQVTEAMGRLQRLSGQSADAIAKDFAGMRNGVASWAAEHNKQYAFLTAAQYAYISQLERQGDTEQAMNETARLFNAAMAERLAQREAQLGTLERGWDAVKNAASSAWDAMLNVGRQQTVDAQISAVQKRIADLQQFIAKGGRKGWFGEAIDDDSLDQIREAQVELAALVKQRDDAAAKATQQAKDAAEAQKAIKRETSGQADREITSALALELQQTKNASDARIALLEQQRARIEGQHRAELIDDAAYAEQKLGIERSILAEKAKLVDAEIAIERRKPVKAGDKAGADDQQARVLALQAQRAALVSQQAILGIDASFKSLKGPSEYESALDSLGAQAAKLRFQADNLGLFADKAGSAQEAMVRFETEQGKFKTLTASQKAALIDAARAVDQLTTSLGGETAVRAALEGMGSEAAKLKFEADAYDRLGEKAAGSRLAVMQFEVEQGKFRALSQDSKDALLAQAAAVDEYAAALDRAKAAAGYTKGTDQIRRETAELGQSALQRKINADLQALENAGIKQGTDLYERLAEQRRAALTEADAASKSWATGMEQGVQELFATVQDQASLAKGLLTDAFRGAEDALVSLVTTGKADFKSLANSIIADLARIQIRKMLASAVDSASDSSSWLGGIIGAAKAYFGGGALSSDTSGIGITNSSTGSLVSNGLGGGRASGGYAEPYATYRVNENGAETLQMGSQGGWIMNAKQTRAAQAKSGDNGGKAITVNINQTNNIGSGVSRAEVSAGLAQAKEQAKAEMVDLLRRSGGMA